MKKVFFDTDMMFRLYVMPGYGCLFIFIMVQFVPAGGSGNLLIIENRVRVWPLRSSFL